MKSYSSLMLNILREMKMIGALTGFIFAVIVSIGAFPAWPAEHYSKEVVCEFGPNDIKIDTKNSFFRFDVDEKENVYFLDQTNEIKVFNPSGKFVKEIQWPRNENTSWEFFVRNGFVFIDSGYDAYALSLKNGTWKKLHSGSFLSQLTLIDGQVFDFMNGKVLFSLNGKLENIQIPSFSEKYFIKGFSRILRLDGSAQTAQDYDGYQLMGIESIEKNGHIFAWYGKSYPVDDENGQPTIAQYDLKLYEFDENLKIENIWDDSEVRVNETTNNVYGLERKNNIWELIRWRKSN